MIALQKQFSWKLIAVALLLYGVAENLLSSFPLRECGFTVDLSVPPRSPELIACAAEGRPRAMFWLGYLHILEANDLAKKGPGEGSLAPVAAMRSEGMRLLERASEAGDPIAPNEIGIFYIAPRLGFAFDFDKARHYFEIGKQRGDPIAMFNLARLHWLGWGGPPSEAMALENLVQSAVAGYKPAICAYLKFSNADNDELGRTALRLYAMIVDRGESCKEPEDFNWEDWRPPELWYAKWLRRIIGPGF